MTDKRARAESGREKLGGVFDLLEMSRDLTDDMPLKGPAYVKHPGKNWRGYVERIGFRLGIILTSIGIFTAVIQNGLNMGLHADAPFDWLSGGPLIAYSGFAFFFAYVVMDFVPKSSGHRDNRDE